MDDNEKDLDMQTARELRYLFGNKCKNIGEKLTIEQYCGIYGTITMLKFNGIDVCIDPNAIGCGPSSIEWCLLISPTKKDVIRSMISAEYYKYKMIETKNREQHLSELNAYLEGL
jgi:hypothetical protein